MIRAEERIAQAFHEAYERLAPEFGYKTREASAVPWERVPKANRDLMCAVVEELLSDCVIGLSDLGSLDSTPPSSTCGSHAPGTDGGSAESL
jgi:hypothetical protein